MDFDSRNRITWVLALVLVLSATFALGQGIVAGSISGTVQDPNRAVITGAKVTAHNAGTGTNYTATTNDAGFFSLRSLPVGKYSITVESPGFRRIQVNNVTVATGTNNDLGIVPMEIGGATETVNVEGTLPLVETTTSQGGATFTSENTQSLPIGGGFDVLAYLVPGVVAAGEANFTNNNGAQFAVNGQRDRSNNFQIDGQNNNDNSVTGPAIFLSNQDALQEYQIITNNFGVEYGRNSGSVVNYVTKSGTNRFHGSAFEYYTGNWADSLQNEDKSAIFGFCNPGQNPATDGCNAAVVPRYVDNRYGGTLGGPIIPNKIFFFGAYTEDHTKSGGTTFTTGSNLLPTPTGVSQLEAAFPGNAAVALYNAIGPYAVTVGNPTPFGAKTVTVTGPGGVTAPIEFGGVSRRLPGIFNNYEADGRVDFVITNKDQFFTRYIFQQQLFTGAFGSSNATAGFATGDVVDVPSRSQQIALDWTRTWSPHFVNQVRFSYERLGVGFQGGTFPTCTAQNILSCPTRIQFNSLFSNFGIPNNLPQSRLVNNSQWQDNASIQRGRHTFKFGGEYDRQRSPNFFLPNINGTYTFSNFSKFLQGAATQVQVADGSPTTLFKEQDAALYFGDDWRVKDNLTLNLGVRWEFTQQAMNLLAKQTVARQLGPHPFWDTTLPLNVTSVPPVPNDWNNFAPNIGFAWTPHMFRGIFGENKTVIRGGFRMAYNPAFYNIFINVASSAPVVNLGTIAGCPAGCFPVTGSTGKDVHTLFLPFLPTGPGINPGTRNNTRIAPNFHNPYAEEWSFGIQRELTNKMALEVRYVGTHSVGEFQTINGNPDLLPLIKNGFSNLIPSGVVPCTTPGAPGFTVSSTTGLPTSERQSCDFRNLRIRGNTAFALYHGLQTQFKFAAFHGFTGAVAYTFSKTIDNTSEIFSTGSGGNTVAGAQNPFDLTAGERGLSGFDYPHVLSLYWNYEFPFAKAQQGMMGKVLGGWQLSGTYRYTSGQVGTPAFFPGSNPACQTSFDNTFFGVSTCRPFLGSPSAPIDTVGACTDPTLPDCGLVDYFQLAGSGIVVPTTLSAVHWIYNDATAAQFFGTPYGNVRRNPTAFRGDAINTVNMNLLKSTKVGERLTLRLEANVYNVTNHMFRGTPDPFIDDGNLANAAAFNGGSFGNVFFNPSGGAVGSANTVLSGLGRRRVVLGAHIVF